MELPPLSISAKPLATWPMTSVVMNAGTSSFSTITPLNRPISAPARMPARMAINMGTPAFIIRPLTIAQKAIRPPTERSMPLMMMTIAEP